MRAVYTVPVFRSSGYPLPFQNMGLLSEQLVRRSYTMGKHYSHRLESGPFTGEFPRTREKVCVDVHLDNKIQAVPRITQ